MIPAKLHVRFSDDYAAAEIGNHSFYFGYEETDENDDWCFTVRVNGGDPVSKISMTELELRTDSRVVDMSEYLLAGMAIYLEDKLA